MKATRTLVLTLVAAGLLALATGAALWAARTGWGLPGPMEQPFELPADHPARSQPPARMP